MPVRAASEATGDIHLNGEKLAASGCRRTHPQRPLPCSGGAASATACCRTSVLENMSISSLWQFRRGIAIQQKHEATRIDEMIKALRVKVWRPTSKSPHLGGNQQKVVISKSLLAKPDCCCSTSRLRGIDIGAKAKVFKTMRQLAETGLGVVFATSDLKEIMSAGRPHPGHVARARHRRLRAQRSDRTRARRRLDDDRGRPHRRLPRSNA